MAPGRRDLLRALPAVATGSAAAGCIAPGSGSPADGESSGRTAPASALVAGSLLRVADAVEGATVEAHGSASVRRLILAGLREPDAVALADPRLFAGICERATLFATNAVALTYDPASPHGAAVRRDWVGALRSTDVELGRTDPGTDPLGYRTVMLLRLAEREFDIDASAVLDQSSVFPEVDLLNALAGGAVDAAFVYRSMAVERGLPVVDLPARLDFSSPAYAERYASVAYRLGDRTIRGAPIRYGARGLTDAGTHWTRALTTATDLLRESGFVVPDDYPRRNAPVGD